MTPIQAELAALQESNRRFRKKLQEEHDKWFFEELNKDPTQPWLQEYAEIRTELNALNDKFEAKEALTNLPTVSQPEVTLESLEKLMAGWGKAMQESKEKLLLQAMGISPDQPLPSIKLPPAPESEWTKQYEYKTYSLKFKLSEDVLEHSAWHMLATALSADEPTANGTVYPHEVLEEAVSPKAPKSPERQPVQIGGRRRVNLD